MTDDDPGMPAASTFGAFDRLRAAPGAAREQSWLAVSYGDAGLLLPLGDAGEIAPFGGCIAVPHTRAWFLGVANLRGQLHGIVDLGAFLGLGAGGAAQGGWLVALNARLESNCALRVEQLAGLRREADLVLVETVAAPGPAQLPRFAGRCFRDPAGGRVWQEIRLAELVTDPHFLEILEPR